MPIFLLVLLVSLVVPAEVFAATTYKLLAPMGSLTGGVTLSM